MAHSIIFAPLPTSILSLPDAFQGISWTNTSTISLYPPTAACLYNDTSTVAAGRMVSNCSVACRNATALWDSMPTMHNCMAYGAVRDFLAERDDARPRERSANGGRSGSVERATELGFVGSFDASAIEEGVRRCMKQFCDRERECERWDYDGAESVVRGACKYFRASPNMDVGGVGVYIGYLMQLGILAYCYLHTRLLSTWIRWISYALWLPRGAKKARQHAENVQRKLDSTRQQAALTSSLVEFQKAQSYYAITLEAISIAALIGSGVMIEASSLRQLHMTVSLLGDIAATSVICITFGQYLLHAAGKKAWYTTVLSVLGVLVSLVAWIQLRLPLHNLLHLGDSFAPMLDECGHIFPSRFCPGVETAAEVRFSNILEGISIAICLLTMTAICFRQLRPRVRAVPAPERGPIGWVYDWRLEISEAVHACMAIGMLVKMSSNGELSAIKQGVRWTFAQLISVTLWVPMIVEYVYAALRGVRAMQSHRVLAEDAEE